MTKLKKSRTMAYAEAADLPPCKAGPSSVPASHGLDSSVWSNQIWAAFDPRRRAVGGWGRQYSDPPAPGTLQRKAVVGAARAMQAETILRIREAQYRDMRNEVEVQTEKRENELALLSRQHQERHESLERLVYILVAVIFALIFVIIYQTNLYTWHHHRTTKRDWWSLTPAHFTIPILSPFTSVVEHETSVVSSRTVAVFICVCGCVAYMTFRYWISRR